jgi:hypothetical protein
MPPVCDDDLYCNGIEDCDVEVGCVPGTPPECSDGIDCTIDACDEETDGCSFTPSAELCDDGALCNGVEVCNDSAGCQAGEAPDIDDGIDCTKDSCDEETNTIVHEASNAACDDDLFCNGTETCDPVDDCQAGQAPDIDDGIDCTDDSCDEETDTIVHEASDAACDDDLFCNGTETCDPIDDCQSGQAPDLDDGIDCTIDSCDEDGDRAVHTPANDLCDDGAFCNGTEICDPTRGCRPTTPPCDDAVVCTVDGCDETTKVCTNTPSDAHCDDGAACNGLEACHAGLGCVLVSLPPTCEELDSQCSIGECDETDGGCLARPINDSELCEDGNACTVNEICAGGQCLGFSLCGVPTTQAEEPTVTDSLFVMRAAVALEICDLCECDVNGDRIISVSDALTVMRRAVGLSAELECFVPVDVALEGMASTTTTSLTITSTTLTTSTTVVH